MTESEIKKILEENERLIASNEHLQAEMIRLVGRNLELSERLETDVELRRRTEVAREIFEDNIERQRNANLRDDAQLMALVDLRLEENRAHLNPDFDSRQLAELLGISQERLNKLFRNRSIYRTPEAYIDNLRTLNALRLLRTKPNYSIASISEDSGFNHVRTMQRRIMDVIGMTPAEYRALVFSLSFSPFMRHLCQGSGPLPHLWLLAATSAVEKDVFSWNDPDCILTLQCRKDKITLLETP